MRIKWASRLPELREMFPQSLGFIPKEFVNEYHENDFLGFSSCVWWETIPCLAITPSWLRPKFVYYSEYNSTTLYALSSGVSNLKAYCLLFLKNSIKILLVYKILITNIKQHENANVFLHYIVKILELKLALWHITNQFISHFYTNINRNSKVLFDLLLKV